MIAADCTAYAYANLHEDFMKGKITIIGCPKLDDIDYTDKLTEIISGNDIKSVTIVRMEVRLQRAVENALKNGGKFIPRQVVTISRDGGIVELFAYPALPVKPIIHYDPAELSDTYKRLKDKEKAIKKNISIMVCVLIWLLVVFLDFCWSGAGLLPVSINELIMFLVIYLLFDIIILQCISITNQ